MRNIIYILIFWAGSQSLLFAQSRTVTTATRWVVESNSSLNIEGSTNVNSFRCDATEYMRPDTLTCWKDNASKKLIFTKSTLTIDVDRFDCHHKFITNDFRKTLKADQNPTLKISFLNLDQLQNTSNINIQVVKGEVNIELAGVNRKEEIVFTVKKAGENKLELFGTRMLTFGEFNLKAPRKLAGLIRIEEEIKVNFHLYLKML